jgi:hypothetical protein
VAAGTTRSFRSPDLLEFAGPAALPGLHISATDVPPATPWQSPEGRRFARAFGILDEPVFGVLPAAQATELVLDAIARSDARGPPGSRSCAARVEDGILGDFRIDRRGDITPARLAIFRVTREPRAEASVFEFLRGTVLDRVITVPDELAG